MSQGHLSSTCVLASASLKLNSAFWAWKCVRCVSAHLKFRICRRYQVRVKVYLWCVFSATHIGIRNQFVQVHVLFHRCHCGFHSFMAFAQALSSNFILLLWNMNVFQLHIYLFATIWQWWSQVRARIHVAWKHFFMKVDLWKKFRKLC